MIAFIITMIVKWWRKKYQVIEAIEEGDGECGERRVVQKTLKIEAPTDCYTGHPISYRDSSEIKEDDFIQGGLYFKKLDNSR